ncbi:MAG: SRPBCC family protein [Thermoanaerobaculia bacterium]|nr:SRPBCC family protein [Thermoanaerobaculia bacterium]
MEHDDTLGTDSRQVREVVRDGRPARAIEGSRLYPTDAEDLWDALTNPERIPRWLLPIRGELELGGRYQLEGNAEGTITRCDPPKALDVTWEFGGNVSWVAVRLTPEGDGVRLTLVHTMPMDEAGEEHWTTYGPGATGVGWDLSLLSLGAHLASGGDDLQGGEAWAASEGGKAFLRASAEAWGRAHAEAGADERVARAMAARTASFYTGE